MKLQEDATFKKIQIADQAYFIQCRQDGDDVILQLTNGEIVYRGKLISNDVTNMADMLDMSVGKLEGLLLQCFTTRVSDNTTSDFVYQLIDNENNDYKFIWKQVLEGGIKFQLGNLIMRKTNQSSSCILSFLDQLTTQLETLKKDVQNLRSINVAMTTEQDTMTKRLENYVKAKDSLEQDLFTKFSLVLNAKKARIRDLKQQVDTGITKQAVTNRHSSTVDEEIETDEEKEKETEKRKLPKHDKSDKTASVTTTTENVRLDDSIEDDDDLPRRSRKRIRSAQPKTPVSAVMPRTTSLPRPKSQTSSSQRSSRRQSSKEISADDLLENL